MTLEDSSVVSSLHILREKKQFIHKISFALTCILQSLRPTNPKYEDNINYLLREAVWRDLALILTVYEDSEATQQVLRMLVQLLAFKNDIATQISETNILKGLAKNLIGVSKNVDLLISLLKRASGFDVGNVWDADRDSLLSQLMGLQLSEGNICELLSYLEEEVTIRIDKSQFLIALQYYSNKNTSKAILHQVYKRIDKKKDRLSNVEMNDILRLIDQNIGDCQLCYTIYFILSKFYTYKQAIAANPDSRLIISYVFALGEANMEFFPAFTDEKSFIYTLAILSEGDRFTECFNKVLMPQFPLITTEASELKFLSELKKIGMKENIKQLYNPLKDTLSQSKNPRLTGQYEYLLKHLDNKHQISKKTTSIVIDDQNFKTEKEFEQYFVSILLMCVLFQAELPLNETEKFMCQALRFCKMNRELSVKYLPFLHSLVSRLEDHFSKNQNFQKLLVDLYIKCLEVSFKPNKISKLEEIIIRTFSPQMGSLAKEKESVSLAIIAANLVTHAPSFKTAATKLGSLSAIFRSDDFKINTKFHLLFRVLNSCEYDGKVDQAIFNFLEPIIDKLEKEQDNNKVSILDGMAKWLPKLEKNSIFLKVSNNKSILFLLDRLFYILTSLVRSLQCDALFEILFELEQWIPLQDMLRKNQAEKIVAASLQNYSNSTADVIELCDVVFGDPGSEYYSKTLTIRQQIHKSILKNLNKYTLEDLAVYNNSLETFGESTIKQPDLNQLKAKPKDIRCADLKRFVFFHQNPSQDPDLINVILETLKELAQQSSVPQAKGDNTIDICAKSLLVSVMWAFQNEQNDVPSALIECLIALVSSQAVSSQFVRKALQAVAILPHSFNLAKIGYSSLYERYSDKVEIMEVLNDLVKIIADNSPKALNNFKFQSFIEQILYFLVFERDSSLMESKVKFIEIVCLSDSNYNELLLNKNFILEKILKADLSNPTFYRPKIIEAVLNLMDQLQLLKGMSFQLCKLLEKYIDETEICYMILLNLKDLAPSEITCHLDQRSIAYILMNSQDKDLLEMCNKLIGEYKGIDSGNQQKFVDAFKKKDYDKCEELVREIEKPHEVEFIKNEVNAFLGNSQIAEFPKVKEFIMTNKKAEPVLYECESFYQDKSMTDLVKKFEEIDLQYPVFSIQKGVLSVTKPSLDMNIESIKTMIQQQNFIEKYAQSILKGNQTDELPKVKLICLLSKIPELTALCDTPSVNRLLEKHVYQCLFYNSGLAFELFHNSEVNITSLINHLHAHLRQRDTSKASQNEYICRLLKLILNHKPKNTHYFIKLMEVVTVCQSSRFPGTIDILANISHEIIHILHQNKGFKFESSKEETYFNNLELILVNFYLHHMTFVDVNTVSMKSIERLYHACTTGFQWDIFATILLRYIQIEEKSKVRQHEVIKKFPLGDKLDLMSSVGKDIYLQINNPTGPVFNKGDSIKKRLEGVNTSVLTKQNNMETLKEYSRYLDEVLEKNVLDNKEKITDIENHLMSVCGNQYYYNRIVKEKIVEKLVRVYSLSENEVLNVLLRLSHNKNNDVLRTETVIKFIKDRLKHILQTKPHTTTELTKIINLFLHSEYNQFESFFKGGLYSTLMEILKTKVMETEILEFFVKSTQDERLVNEYYQRGLIQYSIERITSSKQNHGKEWIAFLGRICINPAIQNKLLAINIHEQILTKFQQSSDNQFLLACVVFFTNVSFNNEVAVRWVIEKKVLQRILTTDQEKSLLVESIKLMHSVAYNNIIGKRYIKDIGGIVYLVGENKRWATCTDHSDYTIPWVIFKTMSTLALDPECVNTMIKEKALLGVQAAKILITSEESCFNPIDLLNNILMNIQSPKQYEELKAQKLVSLYKEIKVYDINFSQKQVETLITTACLIVKWELATHKEIDSEFFEYLLEVILKHNLSDDNTRQVLVKLCDCLKVCKDVKVSQGIITRLEKISLKRKSNVFDSLLVLVVDEIKDDDLVRSIMSKGELGGILCDLSSEMKLNPDLWRNYLHALSVMSSSLVLCNTIVSKVGILLLESPIDAPKLKVLSGISQYQDICNYLIELNAIPILAKEMNLNKSTQELGCLLEVAHRVLRIKELTAAERELWMNAITKNKLPEKLNSHVRDLKSVIDTKKEELSQSVRDFLTKGVLCSLYKTDGSVSRLNVVVTKSLNEINCLHEGSNTVKPKWRMPINDIKELVSYNDASKFQKSHFYKSGFLSKKPQPDRCLSIFSKSNELHLYFGSKSVKQEWLSSLILVQHYITQMLLMIR